MEKDFSHTQKQPESMRVLVVEPEKRPYEKRISGDLESLQMEVGGYIEAVYPYEEPVAILVDEEGKLKGKPLNRALRDEDGTICDVLAGTFLVVGLGEEDFTSLTPELKEQFFKRFYSPEVFLSFGDRILALPMEPQLEPYPDVYCHTASYAAEHGEMAQFQVSARENLACTHAIETAIRDHYRDDHLHEAGAKEVLEAFGKERVQYILALTIQHKQHDGRFSAKNKEWAGILQMPEGSERYQDTRPFVVDNAHPGLVDLFTTQTLTLIQQKERMKQGKETYERKENGKTIC